MESPIKMDDLGVPLFGETPIWCLTKLTETSDLFGALRPGTNWNHFAPPPKGPNEVSHGPKNPALLSIESWLFNSDPYFMVYEIIPI